MKTSKEWFKEWILENNHPCLMAQTVFKQDHVFLKNYEGFGTHKSTNKILEDLETYIKKYDFTDNNFFTFIACFPKDSTNSEIDFEERLWQQLNFLHQEDDCDWDKSVEKDPEDRNFSFSLKGRAFYIVGMHEKASRLARKTPFPTIVFNLHWQFEKLREMNTYQTVRDRIRKRDKKLQGSINPVLEDFGETSEAKQYSGRMPEKEWKCPFHSKK